MMRSLASIFGLFLLICLCWACKSEKKSNQKNKKELKVVELPKFKSANLQKIFKNLDLDSTDLQKQEMLNQLFYDYWEANDVSGGLIISKNGKVLLEKYLGFANKAKEIPITDSSALHIASISKVLTASAILKLVDSDSIQLTQKVDEFFNNFPYPNVQIQDLLNHRSGLPNYAYFVNDEVWDTQKTISNQEVLDLMIKHKFPPYNPPNHNFSYCNTNYVLLALILEKVTGKNYAVVMEEMIFKPLQMNHTFVFNITDSAKVSESYNYFGKRWKFDHLDQTYGDKNIYSTPKDLLKFAHAMYAKDFLSKDLKNKMLQGYSYESKGIKNYGLGIRMLEWENKTLYYHNGWWHGNYTTFVQALEDSTVIVGLGNRKTRSVYSAFNFIGLFGNYPLDLDEVKHNKSDSIAIDSIENQMNFAEKEDSKKTKQKINSNAINKDSTKIKEFVDSVVVHDKVKEEEMTQISDSLQANVE